MKNLLIVGVLLGSIAAVYLLSRDSHSDYSDQDYTETASQAQAGQTYGDETGTKTLGHSETGQDTDEEGEVYSAEFADLEEQDEGVKVPTGNLKEISGEQWKQIEQIFENTEEEWAQAIKGLLVEELSLGEEDHQEYLNIRDQYELEKMRAFRDYHENMVKEHGDEYAYNPSTENEIIGADIHKKYQGRLRELLGEENFARYMEIRDNFNDRIKREQDPKTRGLITIDL